jgi:hypothetical protein
MNSVAGENSDLYINGARIHVQTEDWGAEKQVLVSRVFKDGSVFKTFRLAYAKIQNPQNEISRKKALSELHQIVIDWSYKEI